MINFEDIKKLEQTIKEQGSAIEKNDIRIIIHEEAKPRFLNNNLIPITTRELWNWIKDCKSFEEQKQVVREKEQVCKDNIELIYSVRDMFEGKIKNLRLY